MKLIPLGSTVRCIITGLTGCATTETHQINGNVRYDVQPRSEDGKGMPDAYVIDMQSLEIVDAGISGTATKPREHSFKTGQKVRDVISGHEGVVTDILTFINGCVFATVVPRKTDKSLLSDGAPAGSMLPVERLELVDEGIRGRIAAAPMPTGGPMTRAVRI